MTASTVFGSLVAPVGGQPTGASVTITLVDYDDNPVIGFDVNGQNELISTSTVIPAESGAWTAQLTPNASIQLANAATWTAYRIVETGATATDTYHIVVTSSSSPLWVGTLRTTLVGVSGNQAAGMAIAGALSVGGETTLDGGLLIPTGAASGSVLTSDADGNATWQATSASATPWVFDITKYGAKGDGTTDDTNAIQAAIDAAYAYAQASAAAYAQVYFPVPSGGYYLVNGLHTGAPTYGNAVLTIPATQAPGVVPSGAKRILHFRGAARGVSTTTYFTSTALPAGGVILRTTTIQSGLDAVNGEASVLGGPTPQRGYGESSHLFNNLHVILDGIAVMVAHGDSAICGFDLAGCASAHVIDAAYFVDEHPSQIALPDGSGYNFGLRMPFPGNNDYCDIESFTCYNATYGMVLAEHVTVRSARVLYCLVGVLAIGSWEGSSGTFLAGTWGYISCETFNVALWLLGGPQVNITTLDCENPTGASPLHIRDTTGTATGYVGLAGDFTGSPSTPQVSPTAKLDWKWLLAQAGTVGSPPAVPASGGTVTNTLGRAAQVYITGGTVTGITVDGTTVATSTPALITVPNGRPVGWTGSVAPTWSWVLV